MKRFITQLFILLQSKGIQFDTGLADSEIQEIEGKFNFVFPPDLQLFLQTALPVSGKFPNWRQALLDGSTSSVAARLQWPLNGLLFDIEHNDFWVSDWGNRPPSLQERVTVAKQHSSTYPKLIPVYSHRFIPSEPAEAGNPILSVYQADIIHYGFDLCTYFRNEFGIPLPTGYTEPCKPKSVRFWGEI